MSQTTRAAECTEIISSCRTAIAGKQAEVDAGNAALTQSVAESALLKKQRDDALDRADAWYRNPYLWGIAGILAGGFALRGK